jgi:hypothetical protein
MKWKPPPDWNSTPYALSAIGVLVVAGFVGIVPLPLAVFLVVVVVAAMSSTRKRANRERFDEELRRWHARNPDPLHQQDTPPPAPPAKSGWSTAGTVLAALAAMGGLAVLGIVVLFVVAFSTGNLKIGNK